ncbi:protein of unknown function [Mesonia phycicola]|uniref:DUF4350 domain-containing protein n=1 Tax=Mesonia phycicola TaxID=579105 RepID=A0A1M6C5A5_9FLAO|nr:DUF4350 domain-containing protein [Mesonia phycicola]SHI56227.1 protein of unknown function [Mesonia phycicola]
MEKSYKITLTILLVLLAGLVFLEANQREPINWFKSYSQREKIPYGTYVFYESLKEKFEVKDVNIPPFEFLKDSTKNGTYFFLNYNVSLDKAEVSKLLKWVARGNTAVISSNYISASLLDTLKLTNKEKISKNKIVNIPLYNFTNPSLQNENFYEFNRDQPLIYFDSLNNHQKVLGIGKIKEDTTPPKDSLVNFVENKYKKGKFLLHTSPQTFTNFFLLTDNNYKYAEKFLAYLDSDDPIYWDNHYKRGKSIFTSPLYIILNNKYLKWAYYFVLIAAILFILFEGKRKQKSIKVIEPLKNQTYDYTRTIAGMYLDSKDYRGIANKMIDHFIILINKKLKVDILKQKNKVELLQQQTENSTEEIEKLFSKIKEIQIKTAVKKKDLEELNRLIIQFKKNI